MPFLNRLRSDDWTEPKEWVVIAPLRYEDKAGTIYEVPKGFITDLASIPAAIQLLPGFNVNGKSRRPSVLHDWNYCSQKMSRRAADDLFLECLLSESILKPLARTYWLGVRAFGWHYWNKRKGGIDRGYDFVPDGYNYG